ncbi:MAG TPA: SAM-dependent methyltransferase [Micromonosporaceae bacterium]
MIGSAYWIAASRARESARDDRLFDDPLAARLAGVRGVATMAASERASGGENTFLPVRTRYFDDALLTAIAAGIDQVVLLGAGLDTRPFRLPLPAELTWFEVDRPDIFAAKEPVVTAEAASCRRLTVPTDLSEDWPSALRAAGFRTERRTAWVAEGLLFYLEPDAVVALLIGTAQLSAAGSLFLADVMSELVRTLPAMAAYRAYTAANGLAPPYGHDDPAALLAATGWDVDHLTWPGAPDANYGRFVRQDRSDAPRSGRAHLVTGRRPRLDLR